LSSPAHFRKGRKSGAVVAATALVAVVVLAAGAIGGLTAAGRLSLFQRGAAHSSRPSTGGSLAPTVPTTAVNVTTLSTLPTGPTSGPGVGSSQFGVTAAWVAEENARPGTDAWQITGADHPNGIAGYADLVQAEVGQTVTLYVSTAAASFDVQAYRMGYYHGLGGRLVWQSAPVRGALQPACPVAARTNMVQCKWHPSLQIDITGAWVEGQYLLKLAGAGGEQSYVPLTVWDATSHATYVIMAGVLTDQAFNPYGNYDLYQGAEACAPNEYPCSSRSRVVSFDRPYATGDGAGSYLSLLYPLTRFAEQHGLDVSYWTDITLATHGDLLSHHRVLISPGHDEEWSAAMRQAATTAADRGVNLIFLGASAVLRKVRLQSSPLGPDRQMVNYRDPPADPLYGVDNSQVSQNWWGQAPASLADSELVGADYVGFYNDGAFPLVVSEPSSWLFAGTGLRRDAGIPGVLSGDFQAYDPALGGTPPGVEILAHSRVTITGHPDRNYADTTYYTWPGSHAGVFSSGTVGWIPSLQGCAVGPGCPSHLMQEARVMQEVTGNLLRVFGAGPAGLRYPAAGNTQQYYG
jgi:hypothetical protein